MWLIVALPACGPVASGFFVAVWLTLIESHTEFEIPRCPVSDGVLVRQNPSKLKSIGNAVNPSLGLWFNGFL